MFLRLALFAGYLSKLHGSFGPIVRLWLGPSELLVSVKDASLIKEMLTKAEDKLPLTGRTYNLACGRLGLFISSFEKVLLLMRMSVVLRFLLSCHMCYYASYNW